MKNFCQKILTVSTEINGIAYAIWVFLDSQLLLRQQIASVAGRIFAQLCCVPVVPIPGLGGPAHIHSYPGQLLN